LALVEPLPKMAVSGAAWWRSPKEPIIELSARHKTDDHFWFCLFHEAASQRLLAMKLRSEKLQTRRGSLLA
jgi:hypothetical protein